jgi:hypothetical protein
MKYRQNNKPKILIQVIGALNILIAIELTTKAILKTSAPVSLVQTLLPKEAFILSIGISAFIGLVLIIVGISLMQGYAWARIAQIGILAISLAISVASLIRGPDSILVATLQICLNLALELYLLAQGKTDEAIEKATNGKE